MSTEPHEHFLLLMREIGPALDLECATPDDEDPRSARWTLTVEGEDRFTFTHLVEKRMLLISVAVGAPVTSDHYRTLLFSNGLFEQTGGVRMGLTYPYGKIVMSFEAALDDLSLSQLTALLFNLTDNLVRWRELIETIPSSDEGLAPEAVSAGGLRV